MPSRPIPCPGCGGPMKPASTRCWPCNVKARKAAAAQYMETAFNVPIVEERGDFLPPFPVYEPQGFVNYAKADLPERPDSIEGLKVMVIPDAQVKADVDTRHLEWIGRYAADKRPDVIVNIGDFADMPSLSSYDKGKKCFEGRRYQLDIDAAVAGMEQLMTPISQAAGYRPRLVMTLGNHEERILRAVEEDAKLEGTIGLDDLRYKTFGWEVYDFLTPVEIGGCEFAHYFTTGVMGRPVASARVLLNTRMGSAVMGHVQHTDIAFHPKTQHIGMFVGVAYLHDEEYLGAQGNNCRRQIVMMHELHDGFFDPMIVSLNFLERRYA